MATYKVEDVDEIIGCEDATDVVDVQYDKLVSQNEKAVLIRIDEDDTWIPKSLVCGVDERAKMVTIKKWIAVQKGMY